MKTTKLLAAIAVFLSSFSFAFANNAVSNDSTSNKFVTNQQTDSTALLLNSNVTAQPTQQQLDEITIPILNALDNDVALTSAQKVSLKKKAKEYADKLIEARAMSNKEESYTFMKAVTDNYEAALDSVLTSDQKVQNENKKKERINLVFNTAKSKK